MKHCLTFILIISLSSFSLAKTEPVLPDIEMPKQFSIQKEIEKNNQNVLSKITKKDGKTIYYFGKENDKNEVSLVSNKENATYYRIILGTTDNGKCVAQDFFAKTNTKQSELGIFQNEDCKSFSVFYNANFAYDEYGNLIDIYLFDIKNKILTLYYYTKEYGFFIERIIKIDFSNSSKTTYYRQTREVNQLGTDKQIKYKNNDEFIKEKFMFDNNKNEIYSVSFKGYISNKFNTGTFRTKFVDNKFQWHEHWKNGKYQKLYKLEELETDNVLKQIIQEQQSKINEIKEEIQFFKEKIK